MDSECESIADRDLPTELIPTEMQELSASKLNIKDNTLDLNRLEARCPLDNGHHLITVLRADLGALDVLPQELLVIVPHYLDLQTLTDFRRVNHQARRSVDAVPEYSICVRYAPNAIRGMLCLGSARFNTCLDLYEKICTPNCDKCGDFGGYIYLVTCRRACFLCFTENTSYLPLLRSDVIRKFGLGSKQLDDIPHIRSRPGRYSPNGRIFHEFVTLVDHDSALITALATHGTEELMEGFVATRIQAQEEIFQKRHASYVSGGCRGKKPRAPRTRDGHDARSGNPYRFMAVVPAPFYDRRTKIATEGFYCLGCRSENVGPDRHWRKRYTIGTFASHMAQWGEVLNGFHRNSPHSRT